MHRTPIFDTVIAEEYEWYKVATFQTNITNL